MQVLQLLIQGNTMNAIKYFEKCAEMKYLGITPYFQIYESYLGLGDTVKAESVLTGSKPANSRMTKISHFSLLIFISRATKMKRL